MNLEEQENYTFFITRIHKILLQSPKPGFFQFFSLSVNTILRLVHDVIKLKHSVSNSVRFFSKNKIDVYESSFHTHVEFWQSSLILINTNILTNLKNRSFPIFFATSEFFHFFHNNQTRTIKHSQLSYSTEVIMLKQDKGVLNGAFSYTNLPNLKASENNFSLRRKVLFSFLFELEELKYETA